MGSLLLIAVLLIGTGMGMRGVLEGEQTPVPPSTTAPQRVVDLNLATPAPMARVTSTPAPTPTTPPTPSPSPTPSPTPTVDPRYVGTVICLDPGHGGPDHSHERAAADGRPAVDESMLTLNHALALEERLSARGFTVVLTRRTDRAVNATEADVNGDGKTAADSEHDGTIDELQARINVCNRVGADLLLSLHVNGFTDARANGYETWYTGERPFGDESQRFATYLFNALGAQMRAAGYEPRARGVFDDAQANVGNPDLLTHYVLIGPAVPGKVTPSAMPGAIVEPLFLTNDADAAFLTSAAGQDAIVSAYERAIMQYVAERPSP